MNDDNPYGLPPVPPPPNPFANPYAPPPGYAPPPDYAPPPGPPPGSTFNPYAPPSIGAQGPAWAQAFGQTQPLASPGTRLGAHLLDGFLYFGASLLAVPAVAVSEDLAGGVATLAMLALAIYQWYLLSTTGQSLAKKWLGIRIVKVDGSPVDFVSAVLLRSWVYWALVVFGSVIVIGSVLPLVDALMIFGDERRCLRDHLAGTKVVQA